ncbi:MAG: sugar phosphate isomerase/epimerase, partial [Planctomycetaceae bacterium]|nr:sugar phosphate isomerase/epimerase [Planctomycetaceae bacterium]
MVTRREFVQGLAVAGMTGLGLHMGGSSARALASSSGMQFGLVTYQWGKDIDLPTLIDLCEKANIPGLELRTEHAHKVEPALSKTQRDEVRKRFADSPVTLVGYGSNAEYHSPDPAEVKRNIELTKQYVQLMHDCGGSGVKVKPNNLPDDVPPEKTIAQIATALNEVGEYAEGFGQQIRVEAHGRRTSELSVMKAIFDLTDHPNVGICWNCNKVDLEGEGLEHNFHLVRDRLGATVHIHDLTTDIYPYPQLLAMLLDMDYSGWILLED